MSCPTPSPLCPPELPGALEEGLVHLREGRVTEANAALKRMLVRTDLAGRAVSELFADADGQPRAALEPGDATRLRRPDGSLIPVSIREVTDEVFAIVDRSRERRLEEEIWRLGARAGRPEPAEAPLRDEVAGMIEHEIATAHTVARGYLRMLRDGPDPHAEYAAEALRALDRSSALLANLLALARSDGTGPRRERKPLEIDAWLEAAVAAARPLLSARDMSLELDVQPDLGELWGDAEHLEQALLNLLSNAAKYAPPATRVLLSASTVELHDAAWLCVAVRDEGPGIAAADVDRIFRPFVQGHGAPGHACQGVGLGLAICRQIADEHCGTVEAVPDLGYGLFRLMLPLAP